MQDASTCCHHNVLVRRLRYVQLSPSTSHTDQSDSDTWQPLLRHRPATRIIGPKNALLASNRESRVCCSSQTGYAEPSLSIGMSPVQPHMRPPQTQTGAFWTAIVLVCAAFIALAGAFTAFLVFMRPVLKRMESAAEATETASKAMELSAKEFEQSNLMLQAETPTMMAEIEAAAKEYNELGQTLNMMTAGFRGKNPVKDWSQLSMKRVAKDVSALTSALTPAMDQWRKRIGQIAINFEASHKAEGKSSKSVKAAQSDLKLSEAETGAVMGSQSLQQEAAASTAPSSSAQQAAAAVQAVGSLQETLTQAAGQEPSAEGLPGGPASARSKHQHQSNGSRQDRGLGSGASSEKPQQSSGSRQNAGLLPQEALDLVDTASTQKGADVINEAAKAAETVAQEADTLAADIVSRSQDGEAVEQAYKHSVSQEQRDMSPEERRLLKELRAKKQAAESIFRALERAESAAVAAATASGALENAMHEAQLQQGSTAAQASFGPDNQRQQAPQAATQHSRNKYQRTTPSQVKQSSKQEK